PQCAIRVADLAALQSLELDAVGPPIESHPEFPNRTNVCWYTELDPSSTDRIRARIFERGVGETLSSGTGACGAAIAYALEHAPPGATSGGARASGLARPMKITVVLDGGELERKIAARRAAGADVISLGIGDPDRPTPALIVEAMQEAVTEPETHRYPSNRGRADFRAAVRDFYERRFDVRLDPEREIIPA